LEKNEKSQKNVGKKKENNVERLGCKVDVGSRRERVTRQRARVTRHDCIIRSTPIHLYTRTQQATNPTHKQPPSVRARRKKNNKIPIIFPSPPSHVLIVNIYGTNNLRMQNSLDQTSPNQRGPYARYRCCSSRSSSYRNGTCPSGDVDPQFHQP